MATGPLRPVLDLVAGAVDRAYPGAVLGLLWRGDVVLRAVCGRAAITPAPRLAAADTVYDLASLTKVVATTPLVLQAVAEGRLGLDDPVSTHLPECPHAGLTVRHLLTHTSGLPAWIPFYLEATGYGAIVRRAAGTAPEGPPGRRVLYSDLDFILLGEIVRRALGAPLDVLARTRIFEPLGMRDTTFRPPAGMRERIAPTEDGTAIEQAMAGEAGRRHTWRRTLVWGEVHDSNAHAMGGVSGHAGLFGTAGDLLAYARMWLAAGGGPGGQLIPADLAREATSRQASGDTAWGWGWVVRGGETRWTAPLSDRAYGHTGFTGTSLMLDPARDLAIVLLSNAIHLGRDRTEILDLRPRLAAAVADAIPVS